MPNLPEDVAEVASQNHENFNGTGYPHAISGDQIHPLARLVRVPDIFVNLVMTMHEETKLNAMGAFHKIEKIHEGEVDFVFLRGLSRVVGMRSAPTPAPSFEPVGKAKVP